MQKFLYRRRESSAAASSGSSEALTHSLPCLTPAEGCSGPPEAPSGKLKPNGEAASFPNKSPRFPRAAEYRRQRTTANAYPAVPRWYPAFPTGRRKAGLRLCRGPARQPGSSRRAPPPARRQLCPAAALPPPLRAGHGTGPAAPTYSSSGSRASAEVPGRSAAHGRGAGLCRSGGAGRRGGRAAAPGAAQRRAELGPLAGGGSREEGGR